MPLQKRKIIFMKSRKTILSLVYIALFVAIIAVCSWISIPIVIPFTLQTFAVFVTAGLLGIKRGTTAVVVYILLGLVGVPVFSQFRSGLGALLGNTGGYIIGFLFTALAVGIITEIFGKKLYVLIIAMIIGLVLCYAFGTAWFMYIYTKNTGTIGLWSVLSVCIVPYLIPDAIKIVVAAVIVNRVNKYVKI